MIFTDQIKYRKERVYRVKAKITGGTSYSSGSGFFISPTRFLTCFHVIFSGELRNFRTDNVFLALTGTTEHEKLQTYFTNRITAIEVGMEDGTWIPASLTGFNEKYDVAVLEVPQNGKKINVCEVDWDATIGYGNYIFFGGFPSRHEYDPDKAPFAAHEGMVSSFPMTMIGGEKYEHIQLDSINLGGNSGAPLFKKGRKKVIGIINGNMNMGNDNLLFHDPATNQVIRNSFRIPLSVAYATPLKLLKENTPLFE